MRFLKIFSVVFLVLSIIFAGVANLYYYRNKNNDFPIIKTSISELSISVKDDHKALFKGLSASDATDGSLTDKIMIASISHFIEKGTVNVKYVVFDSDNNSATLTRKVKYTDYTSPQFQLLKAPVYVKGENFDLLDYVKVKDCIDGDISKSVRIIENNVSNYSSGIYPITLEVSNSCGDTARIDLKVTYLDNRSTANIKLYKYIVYIKQNESFDPLDRIESITADENISLNENNIDVEGNLDTKTPGDYHLTYKYSDNKYQGQTSITVVVTQEDA